MIGWPSRKLGAPEVCILNPKKRKAAKMSVPMNQTLLTNV